MKLEQLLIYVNYSLNINVFFFLHIIKNIFNLFVSTYYFFWKISNYSDSFWFIFSNKKNMYEVRYL